MNTIAAHIMTTLHVLGAKLKREEKGATAVEYGIMVAFIAVGIIGAVTLLRNELDGLFRGVAGQI